jgi:hypothetical protein
MARRSRDPKDARKGLEAMRRRLAGAGPARRAPQPPSAPPPPPPSEPSPPEPDDPEAFDREMKAAGVGAMDPGPRRIAQTPARATGRRGAATESAPDRPGRADAALFDEAMAGTRSSSAKVPGVDLRGAPVLDLHGFSEQDALHEVRRFVELHRGPKALVVRIITGRGVHGDAVIRPAVQAWLEKASAISAWRAGRPAEGGEGVVIAQVRRRGAR